MPVPSPLWFVLTKLDALRSGYQECVEKQFSESPGVYVIGRG